MIPAGNPVDTVIEDLVPLLEPGDIILDGGIPFTPTPNAAPRASPTSASATSASASPAARRVPDTARR
jgi:hypothetical protein